MWPASRLLLTTYCHWRKEKRRDDFLWLWKMRKHRILVHAMPLHVTSNFSPIFSFRSFVSDRDWKNAFENLPVLSTIGSIIVSKCRLCMLLVSFRRFLAAHFVHAFFFHLLFDSSSFTKSKIHCAAAYGDLRIVFFLWFQPKESILEEVWKYLSLGCPFLRCAPGCSI